MKNLIYKYRIDNHEELNKHLLELFLGIPIKLGSHSMITKGDSHSHESSSMIPKNWSQKEHWDIKKWPHIEYKKLFLDAAKNKFKEHAKHHLPDLNYKFNIMNMWYHQYTEYEIDGISWHNHWPGSQWSAVYFVEVPVNKFTEFLNPETQETINVSAQDGDMVIFPSWMLHRAPKLETGNKTIIAWNMDINKNE